MRTSTGILLSTVAGFAAGVVTGLLVAPQTGEELRGQIAGRARDQLRRAEARLRQVEEQLKTLDDQMREAGANVKDRVSEARDKANDLLTSTTNMEGDWD